MYCIYGNSGRYIHPGPLFGGGPLLGGSVIGGSTVYSCPCVPSTADSLSSTSYSLFSSEFHCISYPFPPHHLFSLPAVPGLLCLYGATLITVEWLWNREESAQDSTTDKYSTQSHDSHVSVIYMTFVFSPRRVITVIAFFEAMTFGLFVLVVGSGQVSHCHILKML